MALSTSKVVQALQDGQLKVAKDKRAVSLGFILSTLKNPSITESIKPILVSSAQWSDPLDSFHVMATHKTLKTAGRRTLKTYPKEYFWVDKFYNNKSFLSKLPNELNENRTLHCIKTNQKMIMANMTLTSAAISATNKRGTLHNSSNIAGPSLINCASQLAYIARQFDILAGQGTSSHTLEFFPAADKRLISRSLTAHSILRQSLAGMSLAAVFSLAHALPHDGQVTSSSAARINCARNIKVQQTSQTTSVNYSNFNVGETEHLPFHLPNANALALNRILDTRTSQIVNAFNVIRQVCLVNSNDIRFGTDANAEVTKASYCSSN